MKSALAEKPEHSGVTIVKADPAAPLLVVTGAATIAIKAGTVVTVDGAVSPFDAETPVMLPRLVPGTDYGIALHENGVAIASAVDGPETLAGCVAGFHYAPGGNAVARAGGDSVPAINPCSLWDMAFRPACADPRSMTYISAAPGLEFVPPFWADIYLLAQDHLASTSRYGAVIADGYRHKPQDASSGTVDKLDFATAQAIVARHGKRLMNPWEFFAAAFGVTEKSSDDDLVERAGLAPARTSRFGLMQATGQRWIWGTDGDPDSPRASVFGGGWFNGSGAGSRYAHLDSRPGNSGVHLSARGRSDHLQLA
jgi:hypothetical protein